MLVDVSLAFSNACRQNAEIAQTTIPLDNDVYLDLDIEAESTKKQEDIISRCNRNHTFLLIS